MKYSIVFVFYLIVAVNCDELIDFRLSALNGRALRDDGNAGEIPSSTAAPQTFQCKKAGLQCNGCKTVVNCVDLGGGNFLDVPTDTCPEDQSCVNGACSKDENNQCGAISKVEFKCNAVGMFPNPTDCQKFFVCAETAPNVYTAYPGSCKGSQAYDMTRTYCSLPMGANMQCPVSTKIPTCEKAGATFVLSNKSIFVLCLIETIDSKPYLVPRLYSCPNGGTYAPATYKCT